MFFPSLQLVVAITQHHYRHGRRGESYPNIAGGYNNRWHFDGKMGGKLELFAGNKDAACNDYKIWGGVGARVCVDVFAHLKYDNGLSLGGGLGKFNDNNAWCD